MEAARLVFVVKEVYVLMTLLVLMGLYLPVMHNKLVIFLF